MDVRAQLVMVFNLDKCIGCHTCSIACKNVWTDRKGAEYMWWNNVETKPGVGYPKRWEDQEKYKGGWVVKNGKVKLRAFGKLKTLLTMFFQPYMPKLEDYYHPWDYDYGRLYNAPEESDQPVAEPISLISGEKLSKINSGPSWDDDLSGTPVYAKSDPNLNGEDPLASDGTKFMFYIPRICNHCLNPACVAACPHRAIYKRGEDGIVLIDQKTCRGWLFCVTACPYKKVYFNWSAGKSEKCIFCYPRTETGQPNVCAHSCVGRIRYVGVVFYDADRITEAVTVRDEELVKAQRDIILDPREEHVKKAAKKNGISDVWIQAAIRSPVYALVKEYEIALPLHPEFRTLPMTFYIPPLSPVLAHASGKYEVEEHGYIPEVEKLRIPVKYLAGIFAAGNEEEVLKSLRKLVAVRYYMRAKTTGESVDENMLRLAGITAKDAERLYRLLSIAGYEERFVVPPLHSEYEMSDERRGGVGFGTLARTRGGI